MRRAYAQRRVKTGDAFTRRILATIISIAMLVGMGGVGVSVASAEEDATAVDTSAVIEPQAGQQEVEPAETASESQTKQQDEDQAERPDEEQTKQQTEPNGVASEQGDAAKSNDVASEQDDADSIQSITQPDDQPIVLAAQPTALANGKSVTSPQAQATIHVNKPLGAPEKHKRIKKNDDGSYTVNVDVKGAASSTTVTTTQPIDFTLVLDVSGSMDGPMGSTDRTKRLDALKTAVDNFLDGAANANKGAQSGSEPVRVGLVKFSGKESNNVGNDMYRSGGYQYNYSQIVSKLTADMSGLKTKVNELKAAGSTRADNGFKRAVKVMENARTDAKKVVIFFADGTPSSVSDFDASVANGAVTAAKTLKNQGDMVLFHRHLRQCRPVLALQQRESVHACGVQQFPEGDSVQQSWRRR